MSRTAEPAVLFDLDGTVWDSLPGITASLAHALDGLGLPVPDQDTLASNVGPPLRVMLGHFDVPEHALDEGVRLYRYRYRTHGEFECAVYPGAAVLLDELRERGIRVATATAKGIEPTRRMLAHFDLDRRFDVVAAAPMDGRQVHKQDIIAEALAGLGRTPPSRGDDIPAVMVGDRHYDVSGGRAHGLWTVAVRWGYAPPGELEAAEPDAFVDTFEALSAVLAEWGPATSAQ